MAELSPQAQAVLDACMAGAGWRIGPLQMDRRSAAAVLRAAALYCKRDRLHLIVIADELEGHD